MTRGYGIICDEDDPRLGKYRCQCDCHKSKGTIMHMMPCCNNGWTNRPSINREY